MTDFDRFWQPYPLKVGKAKAMKALAKALKKVSIERIEAGVEDYKRHKPSWQHFCHPATWLNGERWDDEWEPEQPTSIQGVALGAMRRIN